MKIVSIIPKRAILALVLALVMSVGFVGVAVGLNPPTPGWQNLIHWSVDNQAIPEGQDYVDLVVTWDWGNQESHLLDVALGTFGFEAGALTLVSATLVDGTAGQGFLTTTAPNLEIPGFEMQAFQIPGIGGVLGIPTAAQPVVHFRFAINDGFLETPGSSLEVRMVRSASGGHPAVISNFFITREGSPAPDLFTKTLQLNEGTLIPTPSPSFAFQFDPVQVQLEDDPVRMSRPIEQVPTITPNPTITIDPTTATTTGGITTVSGELDLWTLIQDALDAVNVSGGVFVWEVTEVLNSSSINASADPNTMTYDTSRFQIRAFTDRHGDLAAFIIYGMAQNAQDEWEIVEPKLENGLEFINTYTRIVGNDDQAALYISKNVVGDMANLNTLFSFTLTLTNPVLTPPVIGTVEAEIVNAATGASFNPVRTVNLTADTTTTFTLAHNEKLRIPELPAGTRFQATEAQAQEFQPEATVSAIPVAPATGNYPQQEVNSELITGTYIIHQTELNRASFTNTHVWNLPSGLFITTTPWIVLGAALLLLALMCASRNRKRIEQLPLVL